MTENFVSPTFDPSDNTWYTDDGTGHGYEAKSLAELQRKLPDVLIENYYPKGYGLTVPPRAPHVAKIVSHHNKPRFKPEIEKELAKPLSIPRFLGNREPEPESALDDEPFTPLIRTTRTRSPSIFGRVDWNDSRNIDKLRSLVNAGLTSTKIGYRFDCSRNAIIGICNRKGFHLKGKGTSGKRHLTPGGN